MISDACDSINPLIMIIKYEGRKNPCYYTGAIK